MNKKRICTLGVLLLVAGAVHGQQKFYRDDPIAAEERVAVPNKPANVKLSDLYDRLRHSLGDTLNPEPGEAAIRWTKCPIAPGSPIATVRRV